NRHAQLAVLQIGQRLVDLLRAITFRDQALELDASLDRHLENFLHVVGLAARYTGDSDLAGNEVAAADRERPAAQAADDRRRAARPRRLNDLIGGFRVADRLEGFVDAAFGELHGRFDRIL